LSLANGFGDFRHIQWPHVTQQWWCWEQVLYACVMNAASLSYQPIGCTNTMKRAQIYVP
jgi:hypothetical protein